MTRPTENNVFLGWTNLIIELSLLYYIRMYIKKGTGGEGKQRVIYFVLYI